MARETDQPREADESDGGGEIDQPREADELDGEGNRSAKRG